MQPHSLDPSPTTQSPGLLARTVRVVLLVTLAVALLVLGAILGVTLFDPAPPASTTDPPALPFDRVLDDTPETVVVTPQTAGEEVATPSAPATDTSTDTDANSSAASDTTPTASTTPSSPDNATASESGADGRPLPPAGS